MPADYEIGYKKPPKHGQFQKGQSGNPQGRPKGTRNLKTDLEEELQELIVVREGEVRKTVSKQRAVLKSLTAKAVKGDTRAAGLVVDMIYRLLHEDETGIDDETVDVDDLAILESYVERLRRPDETASGPTISQSQANGSPNGAAAIDEP